MDLSGTTYEALYRVGHAILKRLDARLHASDGDEIVQRAITVLLERVHREPDHPRWPNPKRVHGFLAGIVRTKRLEFFRQRGREPEHLEMESVPDEGAARPEDVAEARDNAGAIRRVLKELDRIDREIIRLRYKEEMTLDEIGKRLDLDKSNVSRRLNRALAHLRHRLGGLK